MNGRSGTFSPVSADGSEWSGISRYQNTESSFSPILSNQRRNLATPPVSTASSSGIHGAFSNAPNNRRPSDSGNPSPPSSVAERSSYAASVADGQRQQRRTLKMDLLMEENLAQHYTILKRYLAQYLSDEKGNPKPNRARDKLLRLSAVQFQELSTDVYDELLRRQNASGQQPNGPSQVPAFLLPKDTFHPKRNQARQKLSTLPPPRFRDLATDVFYELERRFPRFAGADIDRNGSPGPSVRGLPSRQGTPVNGMNGVRPVSRDPGPVRPLPGPGGGFGGRNVSLGSQVPSGLVIPGVTAQDDVYGRPTAKTFQSNTIIPNKSTLVEDDDDPTGPEDNDDNRSDAFGNKRDTGNTFKSVADVEKDRLMIADLERQISELQGKVTHLEDVVHIKNLNMRELQEMHEDKENAIIAEREKWVGLRSDLEEKLEHALNLNNNLQSELDRVKADHAETERELQAQANQFPREEEQGGSVWKERFENLDRVHHELQEELNHQQIVTNEVKEEAAAFLEEMKSLSARSTEHFEREEKLVNQVHKLEDQIKDWRGRYTRTKTQLRTLRASSQGLSLQNIDATQLGGLAEQDGLIKDIHVTRFQTAIDELLRSARGSDPGSVLAHVKTVVIAVRNISHDIGILSPDDDEQTPQKNKLRSKISATANNLITASKNFVISNGLSPVSLLDAAASHLTVAVVNLIRIVKIRPTPAEELEEDDDNSLIAESPAYYGIQFGSDRGGSVHSSISSPQNRYPMSLNQGKNGLVNSNPPSRDGGPNGLQNTSAPRIGLGVSTQDGEIVELKAFLEDQIDSLLQSIQSLVGSVRADDNPAAIKEYLNDISTIVGKVVGETQHASNRTDNSVLRERADPLIRSLAACRAQLVDANMEGKAIRDPIAWKDFTKKLPPLAFDVARPMKELVQRLDQIEDEERNDGDFR